MVTMQWGLLKDHCNTAAVLVVRPIHFLWQEQNFQVVGFFLSQRAGGLNRGNGNHGNAVALCFSQALTMRYAGISRELPIPKLACFPDTAFSSPLQAQKARKPLKNFSLNGARECV